MDSTYSCISTGSQDFKSTFCCEGLRASDDALGAVDDTPPGGEFGKVGRGGREDGGGRERHVSSCRAFSAGSGDGCEWESE